MAFAGKVTIFYEMFGGLFGDSESWYLDGIPPSGIFGIGGLVDQYLQVRMPCSTQDLRAVYARRTIPGSPRQVDFEDLTTRSYVGSQPGTSVEPQIAVLMRGRTNIGAGMRQFMRCIPESQVQGRFLVISGRRWINAVNAYANFITSNVNINFAQSPTHTLADRRYIASITATPHRGYQITPSNPAQAPAVGDIVSVGGQGTAAFGCNGRKVVISVAAGGASFDVGGARPVVAGTGPAAGQAYWYDVTPAYGAASTLQPERLTERKAGPPFDRPHGRRPNLLPLRQ